MNQFLIAGVVGSEWAQSAIVVHPFRMGEVILRYAKKYTRFRIDRKRHLLETALAWKRQLAANPLVDTAEVARHAGVSPGRMRQILRLATLPPDIQEAILGCTPKDARSRFPEKILRGLIPLSEEEQLNQFSAIWPDLFRQSADLQAD